MEGDIRLGRTCQAGEPGLGEEKGRNRGGVGEGGRQEGDEGDRVR